MLHQKFCGRGVISEIYTILNKNGYGDLVISPERRDLDHIDRPRYVLLQPSRTKLQLSARRRFSRGGAVRNNVWT